MVDARTCRVDIEISGEKRFIVADMNMADAMWDTVGEQYLLWIGERYLGKPATVGGQKVLRFSPVQPKEMMILLHALLASDRALSKENGLERVETVESLTRSLSVTDTLEIEKAVRKALVTCFGVKPGEVQILGLEPEELNRAAWGME